LAFRRWDAAIFHLMTHAFFKALLFLSSGSVILACHHEQNIFKMGGCVSQFRWFISASWWAARRCRRCCR
jgi:NADH-quinone oxidoreductase subunit L